MFLEYKNYTVCIEVTIKGGKLFKLCNSTWHFCNGSYKVVLQKCDCTNLGKKQACNGKKLHEQCIYV
jgi:hypothetical protein